jgi:hypothetical protein
MSINVLEKYCISITTIRAVGAGHLSPRGLHERDLEGGLVYWGP